MSRAITPVGRGRRERKIPENELMWSEKMPKGDNEFGTVTLNPGTFHGIPMVVESFGLGSPHAFRRRF